MEGPHRQRELHGLEPHGPGAQHFRSDDRSGERRLVAQDHGGRARRNSAAEGSHQYDGGSAAILRIGSDARGARSRYRRKTGRPGDRAGRRRHVEGSHRLRELDGRQSHRPGAQHRGSGNGHRARRPVAQDHRRCEGRNSAAEGNHQHDGGPAQRLLCRSDARGARSGYGGQARRSGRGERRVGRVEGPHR